MDSKNYRTIKEIYKELIEIHSDLTKYELLSIACKEQLNEILASGLNVPFIDDRPASLEAIAMILGYNDKSSSSIFERINASLEAINDRLEEIENKMS